MNIVTISSDYKISSYDLGVIGEHKATRLIMEIPKEVLADSRAHYFRITFKMRNVNNSIITDVMTGNPLTVDLVKELTQSSSVSIQLAAYESEDADVNDYIGLGKLLTGFRLSPSDYNDMQEALDESLDDLVLGLGAKLNAKVDKTTKVNGKALSQDIAIDSGDIAYDETEEYSESTVGSGIKAIKEIAESKQSKFRSVVATLIKTQWSNKTYEYTIEDLLTTDTIIVASDPSNIDDYNTANIYASAQSTNKITFKCKTLPTSNINVNIMIWSV